MSCKSNPVLFYSALVLWVIGLVLLLVWALPRDFYAMSDQFLTLYGLMSIHKFGIRHFDFQLITRAGFLLSYPQYVLGLSVTAMKVIYTLCLFASAAMTYRCLVSAQKSRWLLPLFLFLVFMNAVCYHRFMFNYYGNITVFLSLAFAFAYAGRFRRSYVLDCLSALCFVIIGFSVLPLLPLVILSALILFALDRGRHAQIQLLSFILIVAVVSWIFFVEWGLGARLLHEVASLNVAPLRGHKTVQQEVIWVMAFVIFSAIFVIVCRMELPHKAKPVFRWVWPSALLLQILIMALTIASKSLAWQAWMLALTTVCWSLFAFSIITLVYKAVDPAKARFYVAALLLVSALAFANRVFSRAYGIEFLYYPVLWFLGFAFLSEGDALKSEGLKRVLISCVVVTVLAFGVMRFNVFSVFSLSVNFNTQFLPAVGFRVNSNAAAVYENMLKAYRKNGCAQKHFMALEDLPDAYWLFNRRAPFDQSWISRLILTPYNRETSGQNIVAYLKAHQPWCVFYTTYGDGYMSPAEQAIGRGLILPYLQNNHVVKQKIGAFIYRINEDSRGGKRPLQLWLYVQH